MRNKMNFKIIFAFLFLLFCALFINSSGAVFATEIKSDDYMDMVKKIENIDEEKVKKGIEFITVIVNIYQKVTAFMAKIKKMFIDILKAIFNKKDNGNKAKIIFTYRRL